MAQLKTETKSNGTKSIRGSKDLNKDLAILSTIKRDLVVADSDVVTPEVSHNNMMGNEQSKEQPLV